MMRTAVLSVTAWVVLSVVSLPAVWADGFADAADLYRQREWKSAVVEFGDFVANNADDPRAINATFYMAEALMELRLFSDARATYAAYLDAAPDDAAQVHRAYFRLGESAYLADEWTVAIDALNAFHKEYPDDRLQAYSLPYLAEITSRSGEHAVAIPIYRDALKRFSDGPLASNCMFGLARSLEKTGDVEAAREIFEELLTQDEHRGRAALYLGLLEYNRGNFSAAEERLTPIVDDPNHAYRFEALYWRGMGRFASGSHEKAIDDFEQALELIPTEHPSTEKLQKYRAESLVLLGQYERAASLLEAYIDLRGDAKGPDECRTTQLAAMAHLEQWTEIDQRLQSVVTSKDGLAKEGSATEEHQHRCLLRLAEIARHQNRLDRTTDWLGQVASSDSTRLAQLAKRKLDALRSASTDHDAPETDPLPESRQSDREERSAKQSPLDRWDRLLRNHELAAAEELLREISEDEPTSLPADRCWYRLAVAYGDSTDTDGQSRCLNKITDEFPSSRYWHVGTLRLARLAMGQQELELAAQLCTRVLDNHPPADLVPHAMYLRGRLAAGQNDWPTVVDTMRQLGTDYPGHILQPKSVFWMAEGHFRQNEFEDATRLWSDLEKDSSVADESWQQVVQLRLAQVDAHCDRWEDARKRAMNLSQSHPEFCRQFEVDYLIGRSQASLGEFDLARASYDRVLQSPLAAKTETAAMAQWMIGESYVHQGNHDVAVTEFLRVEVLHDWPAWQACGLLQAAKCYLAMNRPGPAVETLSRLLEKYSQTKYAGEASARLKEISNSRETKIASQPENGSQE